MVGCQSSHIEKKKRKYHHQPRHRYDFIIYLFSIRMCTAFHVISHRIVVDINMKILITLFFKVATVTERCRSNTAGHIEVGGNMRLENWPSVHSAFTDAAHRLCS